MMLEWNGESSKDGDAYVQKTQHAITDENGPTEEHLRILSQYFGHTAFRPMQWSIISSTIHEKRDNCSIMATGYGKSLCYQFPPVFLNGVAIVVSPLISLMEDQVLALTEAGISACLLGSANKHPHETEHGILDNRFRLVYVTPEFIEGGGKVLIRKMQEKLKIVLVAIDEAHCVSFWGHDFRVAYRKLEVLRELLPGVPMLAVTATATARVRNDIISSLKLTNPLLSCSGFNRSNLHFAVFRKSYAGVHHDLTTHVMEFSNGKWTFLGPTIVYCLKRSKTEEISRMLNAQGANTLPYHAGLEMDLRKSTHMAFLKNRVTCVVATIAYGMGIDKPDVRNVVHYGTSSSIEAYYQEVGRAGRDGRPAKCVCFFDDDDFELHRYQARNISEKLRHLVYQEAYLNTRGCRRNHILRHFNDEEVPPDQPNCCDNCDKMIARKLNEKNFREHLNRTIPIPNKVPKKKPAGVRGKKSKRRASPDFPSSYGEDEFLGYDYLQMLFPERRRRVIVTVDLDC